MKQVRQKRAKYTPEQLESVAEKLRSMPAVEEKKKSTELSKQEAIKALSKDIRAMQKRGYTLEMIANILKDENIAVSVPTCATICRRSAGVRREPRVGLGGTHRRLKKPRPSEPRMAQLVSRVSGGRGAAQTAA